MTRILKFREALSEGLCQAMEADPSIFVTGISVDYSTGVFGTTSEALKRFGPSRVFDAPAMENSLTGICIGAAAMGKRPVIVHPRIDFAFLAFDQIINLAAKWRYMYGGNAGTVPIVTRAIIGKGWGQGATHSQATHSMLANVPGLVVALPGSPSAAYHVLYSALKRDQPTVILEHRSLFETEGEIAPFHMTGSSDKWTDIGGDLTIVATGYLVPEAVAAAKSLGTRGISIEVIDPVYIRPLDQEAILDSVRRTGRILVADCSHELCGFASEVCALVAEKAFSSLKAPPRRLTLPDCPAPVAQSLEDAFYPRASTIAGLVLDMLGLEVPEGLSAIDRIDSFKGPY